MEKQQYKKLSVEFPIHEYTFLKMACAKQDISIKDFVTRAVIKSVEDYEDELDSFSVEMALKEAEETGFISWEEMAKLVGWEK